MKLHIKNFKNWSNLSLDFPDNGLVLIKGQSGAGKSTILNAIYFALFGVGNKLIKFGQKSCEVYLDIYDLKIFRKKHSEKLVLTINNVQYEDKVAQKIIDQKFGQNFVISSYISQKCSKSFLQISQSDKFNFILQSVDDSGKFDILKTNVKSSLANYTTDLNVVNAKIDQFHQALKDSSELSSHDIALLEPLKNNSIKSIQDDIKNKMCDCEKSSKNLCEKIHLIDNKIDVVQKLKIDLNTRLLINLTNLLERKLTLEKGLVKFDKDKLKLNEDFLQKAKTTQRLYLEKVKFSNLSNEIIQKENDRKILKDKLNGTRSEILVVSQSFKANKPIVKILQNNQSDFNMNQKILEDSLAEKIKIQHFLDLNSEKKIQQSLDNINSQLLANHIVHPCPECKTSLIFDLETSTLFKMQSENTVKLSHQDLVKLRVEKDAALSQLQECKNNRSSLSAINKKIDDLSSKQSLLKLTKADKNLCDTQLDLEKKENFLQIEIDHMQNNLKNLELDLDQKKQKFKQCGLNVSEKKDDNQSYHQDLEKINNDIEKYSNKVLSLNIHQKKLTSQIAEIRDLKIKIEKAQGCIKLTEKQIGDLNLDALNKEKVSFQHSLENLQTQKLDLDKQLSQLEFLKLLREKFKTIEKFKADLQIATKSQICLIHEISLLNKLNSHIDNAQALAISNKIEALNYHVNHFLELLFLDDPMTVSIKIFKETKNQIKPCISIDIFYKNEYIETNSLSGGEFDRLQLAINLSFNQTHSCNLLMLDESISSLDDEQAHHVIENLQKNLKEKLILIVSHQAIDGLFQTVIDVDTFTSSHTI